MLLLKTHYTENDAKQNIINTLEKLFKELKREPIFICIGSNHHILDCFGPMIGTMLSEKSSGMCIYGTLDQPLHAKNIAKEIKKIKVIHAGTVNIAIDACISSTDKIGTIQLRQGQVFPGKALYKRLPPVGHLSITGIVDEKPSRGFFRTISAQSITHIYHMANLVSSAIAEWNNSQNIS